MLPNLKAFYIAGGDVVGMGVAQWVLGSGAHTFSTVSGVLGVM